MARSRNVGLSRPRTRSNLKDVSLATNITGDSKSGNGNGNKNIIMTPTKPLKRPSNDTNSIQISSSPIKRIRLSPSHANQFSSPLRAKKSVAFSDDLISDLPSSPDKQTPRKSILKTCNQDKDLKQNDPNNIHSWERSIDGETEVYGPSNGKFWIQGTVVQLSPNSPKLQDLITGCIKNLKDRDFTKRFEVYATLNNIFKTNTVDQLKKLFINANVSDETHYIIELSAIIKNDITNIESELFQSEVDKENLRSPSKNDPFRIRVLVQALKLINNILLEQELNNFMPIEDAKWFYMHASSMLLKSTISKALISPYLIIMKDCRFSNKRKRAILESEIPETMLRSLINMKSSPSSSVITERFLCFRNFVISFPNIMAKNINHWLDILIMNVCSLPMPFFNKCIGVGTNSLLEVAKVFLSNISVSEVLDQFLSSQISTNTKSLVFDSSLEIGTPSKATGIDYIQSKLESLIYDGHYKVAMDIWVAITIMLGGKINTTPFEKWNNLTRWLRVPKVCFNSEDTYAMVLSLNSWRAVIYNVSFKDFDNLKNVVEPILRSNISVEEKNQAITNSLKPKIKLLTHLFTSLNAYAAPKEVIDALHNLFISILYSFINPLIIKLATHKYLHIYWDKLIQPVMLNFYFKKGESTPYMHELGFMVLSRLIKPSMPTTESNFSEVRCLSNEPVSLLEINSVPPRWVHTKFDKVLHSLVLIFSSKLLSIEKKSNFFYSFLGSIRLVTKKEIKESKLTLDIIDSIPLVFTQLLGEEKNLPFEWTHKTLIQLHDTFQPNTLAVQKKGAKGIYDEVISLVPSFTDNQIRTILNLIVSSLSDNKDLSVVLDLCKFQESINNINIEGFLQDYFSTKVVTSKLNEIEICGKICEHLPSGFEAFIKKVVQGVVALTNSDDMKKALNHLSLSRWKIENYKFFLRLMQNAPNWCIQNFVLESIRDKFEDTNRFVDLFKFLVEDKFHSQLTCLHDDIIQKGTKLEGFLLFSYRDAMLKYLSDISVNPTSFEELDTILASTHTALSINIEVFIKEKIEHLPQVRKCLGLPEEANKDPAEPPAVETDETLVDNKKDNPSNNKSALELVNLTPLDESSEETGKSTSYDTKGNKANKPSEVSEEKRSINPFDIHSFTAMLNSKLVEPPSKKKGRRKRKNAKKSIATESEASQPTSEIQVVSSLEINDEVCESENDTFSQSTFNESDIIEDDSISSGMTEKEAPLSMQVDSESDIVPEEIEAEEVQVQVELHQENETNDEELKENTISTETDYPSAKDSQLHTFQSQNFKAHSTAVEEHEIVTPENPETSQESDSVSSNNSSLSFRENLPTSTQVVATNDIQESIELIEANESLASAIEEVAEINKVEIPSYSSSEQEERTSPQVIDIVEDVHEDTNTEAQEEVQTEVHDDVPVIPKSIDLESSLDYLMNIEESEMKNLSSKARFDMETKLLQFMLRLRNITADPES
ncbi:RAP1-interacting factor [Scheffersomyces coipomensis]|uniref:RAP1-interacting factor n=1 Tax=Scheffersomyces coipomensis TaxID=1788519 RepID=UPI00315D3F65